ncbi:glycosyltransferase family 25 protein [Photobacterium damselae]|uniref:glycosyltransferase family 25 protein n=1 Tax=Photobacterium damselae TaxID=38293 RepID=UPI0011D0AE25|nr:glycosyltransferase family 25 protein [Photobacterium damselae]EJN6959563.1 glycosyltransferase family 25 protein [Photobacterium damselae]KAB1519054.1 glycosyltransferase family 25 protein [Photobacterium damselae subsp. damselae]MCG3846066.1 glycosyltransferase family 25 protein [Photobacterium damselae]MCG9779171.1 glycosyltransferase family 25 protein [Photobacterium damselae]UKA06436.1 glycosyltransferase family 25 protein [Photobacterium damselae subsp. damselae]
MIDIFVINLPSSIERKENISKQLRQLDLSFELFKAVNGHKESSPLFKLYDEELSQQCRGKSLSKGQLGCYASHYLLWQKCVELNKPIIILEDDALIYPEPFLDIIENADKLAERFECIRLFDNKRKTFRHAVEYPLPHTAVHKFSKGHMSATGYFLTPTGAKKFLTHSQAWYLAVDIYMDRFWVNDVNVYGTVPACLSNDPKFDSDIGYGAKPKRDLYCRFKREVFNLAELFRREYHNACYKIRTKRKP